MMEILLFVILFGVVVFVHELGHFLVAKRADIKVERFAIGFGPAILKKRWGETEYALCAFPLGGYVKMHGEEPAEGAQTDPRSFAAKHPAVRLLVAAMGPISNLLLPLAIFTALLFIGLPTLTTKIGSLIPGSPAEKAGLRPGDEIVAADGRPIWRWGDLVGLVRRHPGKTLSLTVDRQGETFEARVTPEEGLQRDVFDEEKAVGKIGISPQPFLPAVGIADPSGPAAETGLRTGDVVTAVNGSPVSFWWQFEEEFARARAPRELAVERFAGDPEERNRQALTFTLPAGVGSLKEAGIANGELFIRQVVEKSVAAEHSIRPGDRLVSINGLRLGSWHEFQTRIRQNAGEKIALGILRHGRPVTVELAPREIEEQDEITFEKRKRRQLGVISAAVAGEPATRVERYLNPLSAVGHGAVKTYEQSILTAKGLWKVLTGQLELKKSVGGPITIFYLAGSSYKLGGWIYFLQMMAMLSITLGLINLLPIPVLDGGHIFFCLVELLKGSPVSLRVREVAQHVGLAILIGLILLTFYVDINRYFVDRIRAIFN